MNGKTKIEWTDTVWNPVTGCTKVSAGCKNCYAEVIANRFWGSRKFTDVRIHKERLQQPLNLRYHNMIFVNSMSDLFHEDVVDEFIIDVFLIMAKAKHQIFLILTIIMAASSVSWADDAEKVQKLVKATCGKDISKDEAASKASAVLKECTPKLLIKLQG